MMTGAAGLLFNASSLLRIDILIWVIGVPFILILVSWLFYQLRSAGRLKTELQMLSQIKEHNIEHELVLKAMHLSTWRYDVATSALTVESDYRQENDNITLQQGISMANIYEYMLPEYAKEYKALAAELVAGRRDNMHMQYQVKLPNSETTYWSETFATVDKRDVDGKPLTIVGATRRIDAQKAIERELTEARIHAEESDRMKSAFLANITHEVRTPLNAIVGFSDILPMAQSEEERNELVKLIKQNNAHLLRLFDDMMNIAKLEAGGAASVVRTDVELHPLLLELVDKYMGVCMEKGLEIAIAEGSLIVHTDRDRLKEILNQYVNNAIKFTTSGSITLGGDRHRHSIRVWVSDTGKGIPEDKCNEKLFDRFVKVDEYVAGSGLGLSICRNLANSIGAQVGVNSVLGQGSTFWVDIPLQS